MRRSTTAPFAVTLLASVAVLLTGCGGGSDDSSPAPSATAPGSGGASTSPSPSASASPSTSGSPSAPAATPSTADQAALLKISLVDGDVGSGNTVEVIPQGDTLSDATLDLCDGTFATETQRTARHQIAVVTASGDFSGLSNETVAYRTAADATAALAEAKAATPGCAVGTTFAAVDAQGADATGTYTAATTLTPDLPNPNLDFESVATVAGVTEYSVAIYQVHDRYLTAVYGAGAGQVTDAARHQLDAYATLVGQRMIAVTDAATV